MVDSDRLFKELISTFFLEFLELFLPEVVEYIEPDSITFLPQEIFTDITSGEKRIADLLVKVKFRGQDSAFLIHLENEGSGGANFPRRMFHYCARLDEKYQLPVYPIVIFYFDKPKKEQNNQYQLEFPDREVLNFSFVSIQLNRLNWRDFLTKPSPVTAALMAKMSFAPQERATVKLECLRMIATLKLNPAKSELISGFVDSYLQLNQQEEKEFEIQLKSLGIEEEGQVMEIVTSWMAKGIEQGIEQGLQQGEKSLVLRQLKRRFGEIESNVETKINSLSLTQIEALGDALLDFRVIDDLNQWLEDNCS